MKMITIEDLQRDAPDVFNSLVNLGVQLERTRVIKHIETAILYDAPLRSVRDAVATALPLGNSEAVHDFFLNAADTEEELEAATAKRYGL